MSHFNLNVKEGICSQQLVTSVSTLSCNTRICYSCVSLRLSIRHSGSPGGPSTSNQEEFRHLKCFVFESLTPLLAKSMHDLCLRKLAPSSPLGNTSSKVSHFVQLVFLTRFYRHIGLNFVGKPMYPLPLHQLVAL